MEVRNLRLKDIDFDRRLVHIVQSKGNKDGYVPFSAHLVRGASKNTLEPNISQSGCLTVSPMAAAGATLTAATASAAFSGWSPV